MSCATEGFSARIAMALDSLAFICDISLPVALCSGRLASRHRPYTRRLGSSKKLMMRKSLGDQLKKNR
jgi:hypothetical protein